MARNERSRGHRTAKVFHALSDHTRLQVLEELQRWPEGRPLVGLCVELGIPQSTMSWHVRTLSEVGVLKGERVGRQVFYCLDREALDDAFVLLYSFRLGRMIRRAR